MAYQFHWLNSDTAFCCLIVFDALSLELSAITVATACHTPSGAVVSWTFCSVLDNLLTSRFLNFCPFSKLVSVSLIAVGKKSRDLNLCTVITLRVSVRLSEQALLSPPPCEIVQFSPHYALLCVPYYNTTLCLECK